jgi:hypothetical protein
LPFIITISAYGEVAAETALLNMVANKRINNLLKQFEYLPVNTIFIIPPSIKLKL